MCTFKQYFKDNGMWLLTHM